MNAQAEGSFVDGRPRFPPNRVYPFAGTAQKIVLSVLEQGLEVKDNDISYNVKTGKSWLSKLARDLDGQVSRATIDQYLDTLLDEGLLNQGEEIMELVDDAGTKKWVRTYYLGNEYKHDFLLLYRGLHDMSSLNS